MAEMAFSEPAFSLNSDDDDLPRTIRRERDAREARAREAREREAREALSMQGLRSAGFERPLLHAAAGVPAAGAAAFDVPFARLMAFFVKAAFAAIPALVILLAMLWLTGHAVQMLFPDLMKLKVLVYVPN